MAHEIPENLISSTFKLVHGDANTSLYMWSRCVCTNVFTYVYIYIYTYRHTNTCSHLSTYTHKITLTYKATVAFSMENVYALKVTNLGVHILSSQSCWAPIYKLSIL